MNLVILSYLRKAVADSTFLTNYNVHDFRWFSLDFLRESFLPRVEDLAFQLKKRSVISILYNQPSISYIEWNIS